jgi:hypothetical protein
MGNFAIITCIYIALMFFEAFVIDPAFWNGGKDDKPISTIIRAVFIIAIGFISWAMLEDNYLWAAVLYGLTLYFGLFNYIVNWSLDKSWMYLGYDWYDTQLKKIPFIFLVFLQVWVMIVGAMIYLNLNGTIGGNIFNIPPFK